MAGAARTTIFQLSVALGVAAAIGIVGRPQSPSEFLSGMRWVWLLSLALFAAQALLFATALPPPQHPWRCATPLRLIAEALRSQQ